MSLSIGIQGHVSNQGIIPVTQSPVRSTGLGENIDTNKFTFMINLLMHFDFISKSSSEQFKNTNDSKLSKQLYRSLYWRETPCLSVCQFVRPSPPGFTFLLPCDPSLVPVNVGCEDSVSFIFSLSIRPCPPPPRQDVSILCRSSVLCLMLGQVRPAHPSPSVSSYL